MSKPIIINFKDMQFPEKGTIIIFASTGMQLSPAGEKINTSGILTRAAKVAEFTGKKFSILDVIAPGQPGFDQLGIERIIIVGIGKYDDIKENDWSLLGGKAASVLPSGCNATLLAELSKDFKPLTGEQVSAVAMGAKLRSYKFTNYKTKQEKPHRTITFTIATDKLKDAEKSWQSMSGVSDGVLVARDLVNEPANILGTLEFCERVKKLGKLGVEVEILDEKQIFELKMGALLAVGQGSSRPSRLAIMRWKNSENKEKPVAFVGKGVVFDSGGISIKPANGMEEMKGDMGGAAAVVGLMHALAARKANVNVVGVIGLVENMPDGNAQRPGDIVTSMSGQTIEVINTDAEGRLVLADALWYCQNEFKPKIIIDLATLTGAIIVALGNEHAGLFSNNDDLCNNLVKAGIATGEKVWRMPMGKKYDKIIDSKIADMKNVGDRSAGSITAAQFLQRFINDIPWAHLDIAGPAMGSSKNNINNSWGSGFGVRLLDRLIADCYEN